VCKIASHRLSSTDGWLTRIGVPTSAKKIAYAFEPSAPLLADGYAAGGPIEPAHVLFIRHRRYQDGHGSGRSGDDPQLAMAGV